MSLAINFTVSTDKVIRRVMDTFLDVKNRLIPGPLTVEELLVHVARQPETVTELAQWGVRSKDLETDALNGLMEVSLEARRGSLDEASSAADRVLMESDSSFPTRTADFEVVINRTIQAVQASGSAREVTILDLLRSIATLSVDESVASRVLHEHGLSAGRLQGIVRQHQQTFSLPVSPSPEPVRRASPEALFSDPMFYDLKDQACQWIDRQDLVAHALRVLSCERGPGLLLIGPQGVGKTSLASEIAVQMSQADRALPMVALDIQVLLSSSQLRGDLERQVLAKTRWLEQQAPEGVLVWLHNIGDLLTSRSQGQDLLAPLRSALRRGIIRLVASATPAQAKQLSDVDANFFQHFVELRVQAPPPETAAAVVKLSLGRFQAHHGVTYVPDLHHEAVRLIARHAPKASPMSLALRALDEAGALASHQGQRIVTDVHLKEVLARQFGLPREKVDQTLGAQLDNVQNHLHRAIVGQDPAIEAIMMSLKLTGAGLGAGGKTKPLASFFFAGPTGVGKTQLATQLAKAMQVPLLRLDMTEYQEGHSTSRLIGAPPSYVGYADGGQLSGPLTQNPRTVVLLDEFEKAAPQVHNLFLQILDRGFLTDGKGQAIDCRQALFVFTSNVGARDANQQAIGFVANAREGQERRDAALKSAFLPEFRNRFDHIIQFNALTAEHMLAVVDRMLDQLKQDASERGHRIKFTVGLRRWLAQAGHDSAMGARPAQRLVDQEVAHALAKVILDHSGPIQATVGHTGGKIRVTAQALAAVH